MWRCVCALMCTDSLSGLRVKLSVADGVNDWVDGADLSQACGSSVCELWKVLEGGSWQR